jgi:hypothetical protein
MSEEFRPAPRVATPGTFDIFKAGQTTGKVQFVGHNQIGPQITVVLNNVMFRPANVALGFIQDEWGIMQVTGEVLVDSTGIFGTITHPDTTAISPLTSQYYIGKGIVSVWLSTDTAYRDVGNVPVFEFTPNITVLTHYSSRLGLRSKDLEVIHELQATVTMHMDEWTFLNLQTTLLGAP